jgi:hypothetical protein
MKHGFMDMMRKQKCSLHDGLEGGAGQVEHESHVAGLFFDIESVVHHEFLHQGQGAGIISEF